jgi:hypothetical protein
MKCKESGFCDYRSVRLLWGWQNSCRFDLEGAPLPAVTVHLLSMAGGNESDLRGQERLKRIL